MAVVLSLAVLALIVVGKLSSPPHLERRLSAIFGPKYTVDIGSASYNPIRGTFTAEYVAVEPDTIRYKEQRRKTWVFTATAIRIDGIRRWPVFRKGADMAHVHVETPRLRVYLDRHMDSKQPHRPSTLPQEHLRRIDPLNIGEIRVNDGEIVFIERARDGVRPGTFVFADISATITNVTNDPARMENPSVIEVTSRLNDAGAMNGTFTYNLASDSLDLDYEGGVGKMPATELNDLLVDLNGIHVRAGMIDSLWFDVKVADDTAVGKVRCLYRGVEFELVDKNSHEQNLKHELATFFKETRDANPHEPDEAAMTASVYRIRREPDDNVLKFVWITVRDGLLKTLGVIE